MLDAIEVERASPAGPVVIDDIILDQRASDNAIAALAGVRIQLNSGVVIVMHTIATHDRTIPAIGNINAVLIGAAEALVLLEQQIIREIGENPPGGVVPENSIAQRDM